MTDRVLEDMVDTEACMGLPDTDPCHLRWSAETRPSTGLIYMQARYYNPETGRFTQADPLSYDLGQLVNGQTNRWVYCGNDPVNLSDPSGLFAWALFGLVLQVVGVGLCVAAEFVSDPETAKWLTVAGLVVGLVGMVLTGMTGGIPAAIAQLKTLLGSLLVQMLQLVALYLGSILGLHGTCFLAAVRGISTFGDLVRFTKDILSSAVDPGSDGRRNRRVFPCATYAVAPQKGRFFREPDVLHYSRCFLTEAVAEASI